jgi:hypothetical protein
MPETGLNFYPNDYLMSLMFLIVGSIEITESGKASPGIVTIQVSHLKYKSTVHHHTNLITVSES